MVSVAIPGTESVLTALKMNEAEIAALMRRESVFRLYQTAHNAWVPAADLTAKLVNAGAAFQSR